MNNKYKFWKVNLILFLVLSILFVIPLNTNSAFAAVTRDYVSSRTCEVPFNVKDSLIMSTITLCIPGILEKIHEFKNNKCQLVVCKYEAILNDLDPSFCDEQDDYRTCKFIVGEIFAIPPANIVEYIREFVANTLANPVAYIGGAVVSQLRGRITNCIGIPDHTFWCNLGGISLGVIDISAGIERFNGIKEHGFRYFNPTRVEYCEQIEGIKEEMEEIIETLDNKNRLAEEDN